MLTSTSFPSFSTLTFRSRSQLATTFFCILGRNGNETKLKQKKPEKNGRVLLPRVLYGKLNTNLCLPNCRRLCVQEKEFFRSVEYCVPPRSCYLFTFSSSPLPCRGNNKNVFNPFVTNIHTHTCQKLKFFPYI